jgi:nicotinamide-nucleotide amidase
VSVEIIAVGSELLRHGMSDTNSEWLIQRVQAGGHEVTVRAVVIDDVELLAQLIRDARSRAAAVLITGGLGPTEDDRTREALALALDRTLESDEPVAERLRELYVRHGRSFGPVEARQARRPAGAEWLDNPLGSAPGLLVEDERGFVAALPGVPSEMRAMFDRGVAPRLARRSGTGLGRRTLKLAGRTEASVDGQLGDLFGTPGIDVTVLGGPEGLELHVLARGRDAQEVADRLAAFEDEARRRLGRDVVGAEGDRLASVVGALLVERAWTVATAESCTAGLLSAELTAVAGSSAWFRGGLIVYEDALKIRLAGVRRESIETHGAVSDVVALELAAGARDRCGAEIGVGITGIAGPGGARPGKPVGTVHLAIVRGSTKFHRELRLIGDREMVRRRTVTLALDGLRRRMLEQP